MNHGNPMKTKLLILLSSISCVAIADVPLPSFFSTRIEKPSLSLTEVPKRIGVRVFRAEDSVLPPQTPAFPGDAQSDPSVIRAPNDIDPQMIVVPQSSVDFKLRVIRVDRPD